MLWVDNSTAAEMKPFADKLDTDVAKLIALVKTADYQTAQIANGAKSLMDEIGASKVTGEEDRYSHTDLYDFKANVDGAKAVFKSMQPILEKRAPTLAVTITNAFGDMDYAMEPFRAGTRLGDVHQGRRRRPARPLALGRCARTSPLEHGCNRRAMSGSLSRRRLLELAGVGGVAAVAAGSGAVLFERRETVTATERQRQDGSLLRCRTRPGSSRRSRTTFASRAST